MTAAQQFPYLARDAILGPASLAPMLSLELTATSRLKTFGLLDTGTTVNVLPRRVGEQLGLDWDQQQTVVQLSGNRAAIIAKVVVVTATIASFPTVRLAFAWADTDAVPIILGQVNFFLEFDVCFFRSRESFEVRPRS